MCYKKNSMVAITPIKPRQNEHQANYVNWKSYSKQSTCDNSDIQFFSNIFQVQKCYIMAHTSTFSAKNVSFLLLTLSIFSVLLTSRS